MINNNSKFGVGLWLILGFSLQACDSKSLDKQNNSNPNADAPEEVVFSRMPSGTCSNQAPSGELVATRIPATTTTSEVTSLYEGPVWINGALYFSDFSFTEGFPSRIQKLYISGKMTLFMDDSGSNGLAADAQGNIIAATHKFKGVSLYDVKTGKRTSLASQFEGNVFNSPNDLTMTRDGVLYFTDPDYQKDAAPGGQNKTRVYRVSQDGKVTVVEEGLYNPNGIALSPDEKYLYVVGNQPLSKLGELRKYKIVDSVPQEGVIIATGLNVPDGMAVDCAGNIYVAEHLARQVRVYTSEGQELANIKVDANVTNVAFGGDENKTLFITGAGAVWKIDLNISGSAY